MLFFNTLVRFNSLQTGKRIQRSPQPAQKSWTSWVSIPFKRESVSKDLERERRDVDDDHAGFNSLQTGKRIQSEVSQNVEFFEFEFQFPSNGKAYPK